MTIEQELGPEVDEFLKEISPSEVVALGKLGPSATTYKPGFVWLQRYLSEQTLFPQIKNIHDFYVAVKADKKKDTKSFPDRKLLKDFVPFLINKNKAAKTVRSYCGAIQSLFKYFEIEITTNYSDLPPAIIENEKYPWSIEQVGTFIKSFKSPMYRCLGTWFIQTGLSNWDLLHMPYSKIRAQYENDVSPFCLNLVRHKTRKYDVKFRAFIGNLGIHYFKEYYASLPKALNDDDLIFPISSVAVETYFARRAKEFLPKEVPAEEASAPEETGKKKRNPCCPSSLRTGFRTFLSDGKVTNSEIEYFMGHNLTADLSKTYVNKSDDSWRQTWRAYESLLTFKIT
ncbi:MAG: hypothetical protein ABSF44_15465 [Candidatus Bathyarchaeia archaeon]